VTLPGLGGLLNVTVGVDRAHATLELGLQLGGLEDGLDDLAAEALLGLDARDLRALQRGSVLGIAIDPVA
jgi:hypothetical protein